MKLAEALSLIQKVPAGAAEYSILLACAFSPLHLETFLAAHLQSRLHNRRVVVRTGLYGSLAETLEQLPTCQEEAAAVFIEWMDLDPRLGYRSSGGWGHVHIDIELIQATLARFAAAIKKKPATLRTVISLPTLALPPGFHTVGAQASAAELAIEQSVSEFAAQVASQPSVMVLNRQQLSLSSPALDRYDFRSDLNAGFPYSIKHADLLSSAMAGLIAPQPPKKGLISDLDDTMWRGIVGEDGPDKVSWDLANHAQIHGLYQQMLQSLARQGVLIGVASKNNAEVAEEALGREDFLMSRKNIFPVEIHWEAKSGSVERILKTWNVGADSVIFVDDSAMELEEVRAAHPGLECILFPKNDYSGMLSFLHRLRDLFGKPTLSDEDSFRLESIRGGQQFLAGANDEDLAENFLASAEATITFDWEPPPEDRRVLELVNKTNQFNLNGTRFTEAEWRKATDEPQSFTAAISYQDRFGPLGKIAVLRGRQSGTTVLIHVWVMSCRAFSRRIEYQTLRQVFHRFNAGQIQFSFAATSKNLPTSEFLKSVGSASSLVLTMEGFMAKCPALYHQVAVTGKDRELLWTTQNSD